MRRAQRRAGARGFTALLAAAAATASVVAGCAGPSNPSGSGSGSGELTVYAAASLQAALELVAAAYERDRPGVRLVVSTDSSAALATKIEQGAPADVFLSADTANAERLVAAGLADGGAIPFARNELAVIVPPGNPGRLESPIDLAAPGVDIVAARDAVPITRYAAQLVANLASQPGYPADFAARYTANVVSREDSVAAVVAKIALGQGDAAIVYVTDARGSNRVERVPVPEAANVIATYAGVVVAASPSRDTARSFLRWLTGAEGQAALARSGFLGLAP